MGSRTWGAPRPGLPGGHHGHGGQPGNPGGFNHPPTPGLRSFPSPGYFGFGSPHGYGNVVFPGTGYQPGTYSPFSIVDPTFGTRLFNNVSGFGSPYGFGQGYGSGTIVVPYGVPVYVPYQQPVVVGPPVAPTQIIYVMQGEPERSVPTPPSNSGSVVTYVVPARENAPAATAAAARKLYLVAFKSGSIYSATEYWLEEDTLHYLTSYGAHNQASLDQLDLELTVRLNRERGLDFRLEK